MDKNEIKKDLYKSKVNAEFSHYCAGNLYYIIEVVGKRFQFPIATIEDNIVMEDIEMSGISITRPAKNGIKLSGDLGTTNFDSQIKGSSLIRWIDKAIDAEEFIPIG